MSKAIALKGDAKRLSRRRKPMQRRARQTVEAVLDAVIRILKRQDVNAVTTNRIAEVAGVSIGSVYQYFPDKRAIFTALHERHVDQMRRLVESTLVTHASSSLDDFVRALVETLIDAHASDPELSALMSTEVPYGGESADAFEELLRAAFKIAITARSRSRQLSRDLEGTLFVLPHLVEALVHAAAHRRPARLSHAAAKDEAARALLVYLRAPR